MMNQDLACSLRHPSSGLVLIPDWNKIKASFRQAIGIETAARLTSSQGTQRSNWQGWPSSQDDWAPSANATPATVPLPMKDSKAKSLTIPRLDISIYIHIFINRRWQIASPISVFSYLSTPQPPFLLLVSKALIVIISIWNEKCKALAFCSLWGFRWQRSSHYYFLKDPLCAEHSRDNAHGVGLEREVKGVHFKREVGGWVVDLGW